MKGKKYENHKLICTICNKEYYVEGYRKNKSKFCSRDCYIKHQLSNKNILRRRKKVNCLECGKEYEVLNSSKSRFCSKICYWVYRRNNPDIKIQSNQGELCLVQKKCLNCNKTYNVYPHRSNSTKFCSQYCFNEYRREIIKCPTCKKEVSFAKYENRKYCSEECSMLGVDKRNSKFSRSVEDFLLKNKIKYKKEFIIKTNERKCFVDFLINDNLVIECFGDYWHCNPEKYDPNYYHNKIQNYAKNIWDDDKQRLNFIINNNYNVIVLWENDWNKDNNFFENLKNNINKYEILKS